MADDVLTNLAAQAQSRYNSSDYNGAIENLNSINTKLGERYDMGVHHNLVLAEQAKNEFKNSSEVFSSFYEMLLSSTNNSIKNDVKYEDSADVESLLSLVSPETSTILFNLASLYFHKNRYFYAKQILEALFVNFDNVIDSLSVRICFLLLEVLLRIWTGLNTTHSETEKSIFENQTSTILNYLTKYIANYEENPTLQQPSSSTSQTPSTSSIKENKSKSIIVKHLITFRIHLYRCRILVILNSLKSAKKEIKIALELFQKELRILIDADSSNTDSTASSSAAALYSSSLVMGAGGPLHSLEQENYLALYLKANLEYLRKNYRKSLKLLSTCNKKDNISATSTTQSTTANSHWKPDSSFYFNNVACIYLRMQKCYAASLFFQKALNELVNDVHSPPISSTGLILHKHTCDILYNNGLSLLLTNTPLDAFRCFECTTTLFRDRPHLWIRLAECCIQYDIQKKDKVLKRKPRLMAGLMAEGRSKRIILRNTGSEGDTELPLSTIADSILSDLSQLHTSDLTGTNTIADEILGGDSAAGTAADDKDVSDTSQDDSGLLWDSEVVSETMEYSNSLENRISLRRAVCYLNNALYLIRSNKLQLHISSTTSSGPMAQVQAMKEKGGGGGGGGGKKGGDEDPDHNSTTTTSTAASSASNPFATHKQDSNKTSTTSTTSSDNIVDGTSTAPTTATTTAENPVAMTGDEATGHGTIRMDVMEESVLLQLAYVHLCIGDPIWTLNLMSSMLLEKETNMPILTVRNRFLAQTYYIEALCCVGRTDEALEMLEYQLSPGDQNIDGCTLPLYWSSDGDALPTPDITVQAIALVNRGVVYGISGALIQAQNCMEEALHLFPDFTPAIQGLIYILLRRGMNWEALHLLQSSRMM